MEYYEANKQNPNILLRFLETKYVSKNNSIQQTFDYIFSHGDTIHYDELISLHTSTQQRHAWRPELENKDYENSYAQLYDLIKKYNWKAIDTLFSEQYNNKEHFRIIFALLAKWYYQDKTISRLQYENTLGIQQARWAQSSDNPVRRFLVNGIKGKLLDFTLNLVKNIDHFPYEVKLPIDIQWCYYQHSKNKIVYTATYKLGTINVYHMAIPETFNLANCVNVYRPRLVCGSLKSCSLLKFMKDFGERPYICHHPDLKHNSTEFDGSEGMNVFEHWAHDTRHLYVNMKGKLMDTDPSSMSQQKCLQYNDLGYIYHPLSYQQQEQRIQLQDSINLISELLKQPFEDQLKIIKSIKKPFNLYSYLIVQEFCIPIKQFMDYFHQKNFARFSYHDDFYSFNVFKDSFPVPAKKFDFDVEKAIRLLCHEQYFTYYYKFLDKLLLKDDLKAYFNSYLTNFKTHLDLFEKAAQDLDKVEILERIQLLKQKLI